MRMLVSALLAVILTGAVFGTIALVVQQMERQGADDVPLALASHVAADPAAATSGRFDIGSRMDAFAMTFTRDGRVVRDAVDIGGRRVVPPAGVVADAARTGRDQITWEPVPGLRVAVVAIRSSTGVVVAGQSLAPVERRIDALTIILAAAGLGTAAIAVAGVYASAAWMRVVSTASPAGS